MAVKLQSLLCSIVKMNVALKGLLYLLKNIKKNLQCFFFLRIAPKPSPTLVPPQSYPSPTPVHPCRLQQWDCICVLNLAGVNVLNDVNKFLLR